MIRFFLTLSFCFSTSLFAGSIPEDDILLDFVDDIQTLLDAERENLPENSIEAIENLIDIVHNYLDDPGNVRTRVALMLALSLRFLRAMEVDGITPREQLFLDLLEAYFPRIYLPPLEPLPEIKIDTSWVDWSIYK